jgi:ribosomal protein S14
MTFMVLPILKSERGVTMSGQPAQTKTIRSQLLADMKDGAYASCERLPRESILAEKLGISRTQLRDILASLELHHPPPRSWHHHQPPCAERPDPHGH